MACSGNGSRVLFWMEKKTPRPNKISIIAAPFSGIGSSTKVFNLVSCEHQCSKALCINVGNSWCWLAQSCGVCGAMLPVASLRVAFKKALLNATTWHNDVLCGKQCQAANWGILALSACAPKQAVLLLLLQLSPSCGSSAEHLRERKRVELRGAPEDPLLPANLSTKPVVASSWWSNQGRCPTSIRTSARTQWESCCFKTKVGIPDFLPPVMSGKIKGFLVMQSQH